MALSIYEVFASQATTSLVVLIILTYLAIVAALRHARRREMHSRFEYPTRASLSKMTIEDAQKIQNYLFKLEFPFTMQKALEFALFRTYGIPSISELLVQTTQLSDPESASKRVEDTKVLIAEFVAQSPTSDRSRSAIARMNYMHSLYQKSGRISNDDMLYTLSLFALEPIRWVTRHEWRDMTDMERCAIGVFWKAMGDAMRINYSSIASATDGWKDGLHWLAELEAWSIAYEESSMLPDICNKKTADQTTSILLWRVPGFMRPFGIQAVSSLMDERLRKAMMYGPPSRAVDVSVQAILKIRKQLLRYLALPRPVCLGVELVSTPDEQGRLHILKWDAEPWYVESSFGNRWGLIAWLDWLSGRPIPGDMPDKYKPHGFTISEIGPRNLTGKGANECEQEVQALEGRVGRGCPMAFEKA